MTTPTPDPTTFTEAQQRAAYDTLGLDPAAYQRTRSIVILPARVTVVRLRAHPATGQPFLDDATGEVAVDAIVLDFASGPAA